jgi:hypothetical protein
MVNPAQSGQVCEAICSEVKLQGSRHASRSALSMHHRCCASNAQHRPSSSVLPSETWHNPMGADDRSVVNCSMLTTGGNRHGDARALEFSLRTPGIQRLWRPRTTCCPPVHVHAEPRCFLPMLHDPGGPTGCQPFAITSHFSQFHEPIMFAGGLSAALGRYECSALLPCGFPARGACLSDGSGWHPRATPCAAGCR